MNYSEVLIQPILSEKTTMQSELKKPKYAFWVNTYANKAQVSQAIYQYFGVRPMKVNMQNQYGKWKRVRRDYGLTPQRKKAVVTLKHGDKIDMFEPQ